MNDGQEWEVKEYGDANETPNAFTYGTNSLYISSSLVKLLNEREAMAVILHEAGHTNYYHVAKSIAGENIFMSFLMSVLIFVTHGQFATGLAIGFPFWWLYHATGGFFIPNFFSRMHEWEADDYAHKYGYAKDLATALTKMGKYYNANMQKCTSLLCTIVRTTEELFSTHPDIRDRIEVSLKKSKNKNLKGLFSETIKSLGINPLKFFRSKLFRKISKGK